MSRSYRKTLGGYICRRSKYDHLFSRRRFRRYSKQSTKQSLNNDNTIFFTKNKEVSDLWSFAQDGEYYVSRDKLRTFENYHFYKK